MNLTVKKGSTSVRLTVFIADSSSTTGAGKTGLAYNSSGLKWYYWREDTGNSGGVSVTPATATRGTFTSGGFIEIDATNMPGWYEIGVPNAALASGSNSVVMHLMGVTNMAPLPLKVGLVAYDPQDAAALGLTNLDGTISSRLASSSISLSSGKVTVGTNDDKTGYALSVSGVAAIWDALTSGIVTAGSIGKRIIDYLTGDIFTRIGASGSGLTAIGDTRLANLDATVSSRLASASYSAPPSAATVASQVRTELGTELGMIDAAVSTRSVAGDAMTLTTGERTAVANEVESQIINEADAEKVLTAITDKIASVNPSLGDLTLSAIALQVRTELATELGRIDVAISTRLATSGYTAPPSAAQNATAVRTELSTELANLDAAISSRLATAGYTAPDNASIAAILIDTNELQTDWVNGGRLDLLLDAMPGAVNNYTGVVNSDGPFGTIQAVKVVADMLDDTLVNNAGTYQFTAASLALAPTGGSAPTTDQIVSALVASDWAKRAAAVLYGKLSGAGTGEEVFYGEDGMTVLLRITATKRGNRTEIAFT